MNCLPIVMEKSVGVRNRHLYLSRVKSTKGHDSVFAYKKFLVSSY